MFATNISAERLATTNGMSAGGEYMAVAMGRGNDETARVAATAVDADIVATLVAAVGAIAWTLSFHAHDGVVIQLGSGGTAVRDPGLAAELLNGAVALDGEGVADSFDRIPDGRGCQLVGGTDVVCAAFASASENSAIIFVAAIDPDARDAGSIKAALRTTRRLVTAYFRLWQASAAQSYRSASLEAALDAIDLGVILVDQQGRISFANAMANAVLTTGTVLRQRGRTLAAATLPETMKLQSALALAIAMNGEESNVHALPEQSALLKLTAGTERLIIAAVPAKLAADRPGAVAAMVLILSPAGEPEKLVAPACRLYGMSPVETRLACHLVAGRSLQEASHMMRIKDQTARSYLKQIFSKTDVNRQVDLVRLLLSTLIRTHANASLQSV